MTSIVTVFGATGTQGFSVVQALLKDGTFTPRGVTRDLASQGAKDLKSQGAQVVQVDISDESSVKKALEGSEAVFIVTIPWQPISEKTQATNIINASKAVGVKYIIWSSLPSVIKESNGELTAATQFDDKAEIDDILRASDVPHTILQTSLFAENLWKYRLLTANPSGDSFTLITPRIGDKPQIWLWVARDLGSTALALLKAYHDETKKSKVLGQTFVVQTEKVTGPEFAVILSEGLGKTVNFVSPPSAGVPYQDDMFDFNMKYCKFEEAGIPDRRLVDLGVKFGTLREFVEETKATLLKL